MPNLSFLHPHSTINLASFVSADLIISSRSRHTWRISLYPADLKIPTDLIILADLVIRKYPGRSQSLLSSKIPIAGSPQDLPGLYYQDPPGLHHQDPPGLHHQDPQDFAIKIFKAKNGVLHIRDFGSSMGSDSVQTADPRCLP
jgi:hypothetical protein